MRCLHRSDTEMRQLAGGHKAIRFNPAFDTGERRFVLFEALFEAGNAEYERIKAHYGRMPGANWADDKFDIVTLVGDIANMDIHIRIRTAVVHGCHVGFWRPASVLCHRDMVWAWLDAHTAAPSSTGDYGPIRVVPDEWEYDIDPVHEAMCYLSRIQDREAREGVGADGLTPAERRTAPFQDGRRARRDPEYGGCHKDFPRTRDKGPWDSPRSAALWAAGWDFEEALIAAADAAPGPRF